MKKSSLLSLATAGAIVATSVGTFAAWDTLSTETNAINLTYASGVNVSTTVQPAAIGDALGGLDGKQEVSTTFTIAVDNLPANGTNTMTLSAVDDAGAPISVAGLSFEFVDSDGTTPLIDGEDTSLTETNQYTVKVKLDTAAADEATVATVTNFKVKADLTHAE